VDPDVVRDLLVRLNTAALLQHGGPETVALVVVNGDDAPVERGLAVFHARFPVRTEIGAQPVTVRDAAGQVVPSRIADQSLDEDEALPPGRVWWSLELWFLADDLPAQGWRAYAATYGAAPNARADAERVRQRAAAFPTRLAVYETDCHPGDLPLPVGSTAALVESTPLSR
jgi:hypothetical protein